jgi:hypothetical protein
MGVIKSDVVIWSKTIRVIYYELVTINKFKPLIYNKYLWMTGQFKDRSKTIKNRTEIY